MAAGLSRPRSGRKQRQMPPVSDRSKSATRIANAQKRLKDKAALLSNGTPQELQKPAAEGVGSPRAPGSEASDEAQMRGELFGKARKERPPSPGKKQLEKEVAAAAVPVLTRLSPAEDIVMDAANLDIPSGTEESGPQACQVTGAGPSHDIMP